MVVTDFKIERISDTNLHLVNDFISQAGNSLQTFRYFNTRSISAVSNHLVTLVFRNHQSVLAYGHIDKSDNGIWLGIAVSESARAKGLGHKMLEQLLSYNFHTIEGSLRLTVDKENQAAISLYKKFGFEKIKETEKGSLLMEFRPLTKVEPYVSSLAMMGESAEKIINTFCDNNWPLEFSSGMPYREDMEELYRQAPIRRMPHNYFPAPKIPFVLNLASANLDIRRKSIDHCKSGLRMAKESNSPFFCAHAGFCIDPRPDELGRKISYKLNFDREENKALFIQSLEEILIEADRLGINFLIENNVIAPFNLLNDGVNPLLCCEHTEIEWLVRKINHPRLGLLLDTAHLKVSAQTLKLDLENETERILPHVRAMHHSDNNGLEDTNEPLTTEYWFLRFLNRVMFIPHVIEVKNLTTAEIKNQIKILQN